MAAMQIEEPPPGDPPFDSPYAWIGGEEKIRALVERFYDLMDLEPDYAELRHAHGPELANARQRLFWFLCGWMGGPSTTQSASGIRGCACGTCRFRSVLQSVTSGWPAWTRRCKRPR
jgi:hypothetical protein